MIIQGHPELGLQEHQQEAYEAVKNAYIDGNKAAVVIPTGCGKSFIALQLMEDNRNKNMLFIAPTNAIKNQMYSYITKYIVGEETKGAKNDVLLAHEHFPKLKIILYQSLLKMDKNIMDKLNPDIIIMDELHRTGAENWGPKINELIDNNPNAKILGVTATPDRMDDKNVIDELFEGNVNYELTLVDAIRKKIVNPPDYVKCDYSLKDELDSIQITIAECKDEETKKDLQERYDKMRKIVDNAEGIPELFSKNMKNRQGKYIIFCKDEDHMKEMMDKSSDWFGNIDESPEIYSVISKKGQAKNRREIEKFTESKSEHLKLLYSVDMLNEGLHVEDISGVIMLRPTDSRIIYLQQLGRALSSDTSREKTIVFDIVNNYIKNNLDKELNYGNINGEIVKNTERNDRKLTTSSEGSKGQTYIDIFKIQGETKEFLQLLEEVKEITGYSKFLLNARKIKKWMEDNQTIKPPSSSSRDLEEKSLGIALNNIKRELIKPYKRLETEEEREEYKRNHPELEEVMQIVSRLSISKYLVNAKEIESYILKNNITKPLSTISENDIERDLAEKLSSIRRFLIKPYTKLETEEEKEEYKEKHPDLEEIMQIMDKIDTITGKFKRPTLLVNVKEIEKWMLDNETEKTPNQESTDIIESKLGKKLSYIKWKLINPYKRLETEEEREEYKRNHPELEEIMEIVDRIDIPVYLENARKIKKWMEDNQTIKLPSSSSRDEYERKLGTALSTIRQSLIKPYTKLETEKEKEDYRKKYPELEEVMQIVSRIDKATGKTEISAYLTNAREIEQWMQENKIVKYPSRESKDEEEKKFGKKLTSIRKGLVAQYTKLETEEEREEYKRNHPELEEVMKILGRIDNIVNKNYVSPYLESAQNVEKWMLDNESKKTPSEASKDETERKLGGRLRNIRRNLIKPYLLLETEEEREEYKRNHPELEEVMQIIDRIDTITGKNKQKQVEQLAQKDLSVTKKLEEARKLEKSYEDMTRTAIEKVVY